MTAPVIASAPGRICLFGDHQDYLGLPIISAALSAQLKLSAWHHGPPGFRFRLTNPERRLTIPFDGVPLLYEHRRDYLRACVNVLLREGFAFSQGIEGSFLGALPVGLGASSAMIADWLTVLSQLADQPKRLTNDQLAELIHAAEVLEFGELASPAEQYVTAMGGICCITTSPTIAVQALTPQLGSFVVVELPESTVGTGLEGRADTSPITRNRLLLDDVLARIDRVNTSFSLRTASLTQVTEYKDQLAKEEYLLLKATVACRDLTTDALTLLQTHQFNHARLGQLLTQYHTYLRDAFQFSFAHIDRLLDVALRAGGLGGKINTAGGGGSLFVYAPDNARAVADALDRAGAKATVVHVM